jgi:hypothetical protein
MDLGHWELKEGLQPNENAFGFIYEITNNVNGRKYIGKKQCISRIKRKPLKGKKRNRIDHKESDWKSYTGSSKDLNEDIEKHGKEKFTFTILEWCNSKFELGYKEIKLQLEKDVLLKEEFYNGICNVRLSKAPKLLRI